MALLETPCPPSTYGIEPLISERQLSKLLSVSLPTMARWRIEGKAPRFVVLGLRRLAYRPSDVNAWLVERERVSGMCRLDCAAA
jgi:predicted DNA-binding transcriptional regulator AlpA